MTVTVHRPKRREKQYRPDRTALLVPKFISPDESVHLPFGLFPALELLQNLDSFLQRSQPNLQLLLAPPLIGCQLGMKVLLVGRG